MKKVLQNSNKLCQDTQLQIGNVAHLQRHLSTCQSDGGFDGLTFGKDVKCVPYYRMCQLIPSDEQYQCPPLMRLLQSKFFCYNSTNFEGKNVCVQKATMKCSGNSPSHCYERSKHCPERYSKLCLISTVGYSGRLDQAPKLNFG